MSDPAVKWDDEVAWDDEQPGAGGAAPNGPDHAEQMATFEDFLSRGETPRTRGRGIDAPMGPTKGEAAVRGLGAGLTLRHGDEAGGFGAFLAGHNAGTGGSEGISLGDLGPGDVPRAAGRGAEAPLSGVTDFNMERDAQREADRQAEEAHPYVFGATELAGASAPGALVAPLSAAGGGAVLGGIHGEGASNAETPGGVALDTITGAALGAAGGKLIEAGAPIISRGVKRVTGAVADKVRTGASALKRSPDAIRSAAEPALGASAAEREIELGGPEMASKAQIMADAASAEGRQARALAHAGADEATIEAHAAAIGKDVDELLQHGEAVKWDEDIASKGRAIKNMVQREAPPPDGLTKADAVYDSVRREWDNLVADVGDGEGAATVKRLQREAFDAYENRLKKAADNFDPSDPSGYVTDRFMALDDLKRHLQKEVARARVPFDDLIRDRMEAPIRTALEDDTAWGVGPATLQKVRNAGWTRRLRAEGSPESTFLARNVFGEAGPDPYRIQSMHDPAKVLGIVKGAGSHAGEQGARTLNEWAGREADLLGALTSHEGADPALVAKAARARELANSIRQRIAQRAQEAAAAADMARINAPQPLPEGLAGRALAAVPRGKEIAAALRPQPIGQRAALIQQLEQALSMNPNNAAAITRLQSLGGHVAAPPPTAAAAVAAPIDATVPGLPIGKTAARAVQLRQVLSAPEPSSLLGGSAPSMANTESPREKRIAQLKEVLNGTGSRASDMATADPAHGQQLAQTPQGQERDMAYAHLVASDPAFRARERSKSQEEEEE